MSSDRRRLSAVFETAQQQLHICFDSPDGLSEHNWPDLLRGLSHLWAQNLRVDLSFRWERERLRRSITSPVPCVSRTARKWLVPVWVCIALHCSACSRARMHGPLYQRQSGCLYLAQDGISALYVSATSQCTLRFDSRSLRVISRISLVKPPNIRRGEFANVAYQNRCWYTAILNQGANHAS